jgi:hypothetical protein
VDHDLGVAAAKGEQGDERPRKGQGSGPHIDKTPAGMRILPATYRRFTGGAAGADQRSRRCLKRAPSGAGKFGGDGWTAPAAPPG